jgi:hypothetical protein
LRAIVVATPVVVGVRVVVTAVVDDAADVVVGRVVVVSGGKVTVDVPSSPPQPAPSANATTSAPVAAHAFLTRMYAG